MTDARTAAYQQLVEASRLNRGRKIGHAMIFLRAACAWLDAHPEAVGESEAQGPE